MEPGPEQITLRGSVCDHCRARKIKCDRRSPCSSCVASRTSCQVTRSAPEKRQRILISSRYESEIANVNERLKNLEILLQNITNNSTQSVATSCQAPSTEKVTFGKGTDIPFKGDSSFSTQSRQMALALEDVVGNPPKTGERAMSLSEYSGLADTGTHADTRSNEKAAQRVGPDQQNLPSLELVRRVLRYSKSRPQAFFGDHPYISLTKFTLLCQQVYFAVEEYSIGVIVIVNCGLHRLLQSMDYSSIVQQGLETASVKEAMSICKTNTVANVMQMSVVMEPSFENIMALLLSSGICMESSEPFLAWKLVSQAAMLCQDAGYHRLPDKSTNEDDKYKRIAFWYLYAAEKGFCFNLGRSSVFQDYDITTARPSCPGDLEAPWGALYLRWLDLARLQDEIYQQLFSGGARHMNVEIKAQRAQILVQKLWTIYDPSLISAASSSISPESINTFKLLFYSVLTMASRMISPQPRTHPLQTTDECKSAACTVLDIYNQTWELITEHGIETGIKFVHWTILYCPFVSYLVVFGAVIAESNHEYFRILESTSNILHMAADFSPEMTKLDHVCGSFYQAAKAHLGLAVQTSHPDSGSQDHCHNLVETAEKSQHNHPLDLSSDFPLLQQDWDQLLSEWTNGFGPNETIPVSFVNSYFPANLGPP